jgi:hypothetical protein
MNNSPQHFQVPAWKQRLLSIVTGLVLTMIGWSNLPDELFRDTFDILEHNVSPEMAYRARCCDWYVRYSAYFVGLNGKWQMYGGQSRFNWRYIISAHYDNGEQTADVILPLPRQSERTWWQSKFCDYKEAKFLLNIYGDELARETYARYLARQYPEHEGLPISRIRYTLAIQHILPPIVAEKAQQILEPEEIFEEINDFDVAMEYERSGTTIAGL